MLTALTFTVALALAQPGQILPSPEEQSSLNALKKFGIQSYGESQEVPLGTILVYRPHPKAERPPSLTAKDLAALKQLPRTLRLNLEGAPIGDDVLALLGGMSEMTQLDLSATQITDEGLKKLVGLKKLQWLKLAGTKIGDEGLKSVAALKKLQFVTLDRTAVTDKGIAELAGLPELYMLEMRWAKFTDACFKPLASLPALTTLSLGGCPGVTGSGLTAFEGNEKVTALDLSESAIGDSAVKSIRKLPNLDRLWLYRTKLTDKGFIELAAPGSLPKLRLVNVIETVVSDEGLKALYDAKALPMLNLIHVERTRVTAEGAAALKDARPKILASPYP